MDNVEAITFKKAVTGAVQPKTGIKAFVFMLWIFFFLTIGFTVWRAYFKPIPTQHQDIVAQDGSHVTIIQKQEEKEKKWWIPKPWVEPYIFKESDRDGWGIRAGCRWEF